jgi:hypothetical protein
LSVGGHTVFAIYNGSSKFGASTSATLTQKVNPANTTIAFSASMDPSVFGQPVTFTAAVSPAAPGAGLPTGSVTFLIDGTAQAPVPLSNGNATLTTSMLSVGGHEISMVYSGDGNFNTSSLDPLQTVNKANTTILFSASVSPSVFGQIVSFTALVAPVAPGTGIPTGSVTFSIDGVAQVPSSLNGGVATFNISTLRPGSHEIAMTYNGDAGFNSSTLDPAFTVVKANTTTSISASAASSAFGQAVVFTAAVGVVAPGAGVPTGSVTFTIDGTAQLVPLSNGQATFATSTLGAGNHTISAAYSGDGNFNASTSAVLSYTVNGSRAATTTVLHSSAAWSLFGHPVTISAVVSSATTGVGIPSGSVTFVVDGKAQATVILVNGTASFTTSGLAPGNHSIVAIYNGDSSFTGSTSSPSTLTVEQHGHSRHHHRHRKEADKDNDRDDAKYQHSENRSFTHSDPLLQRILALTTRILSSGRKT